MKSYSSSVSRRRQRYMQRSAYFVLKRLKMTSMISITLQCFYCNVIKYFVLNNEKKASIFYSIKSPTYVYSDYVMLIRAKKYLLAPLGWKDKLAGAYFCLHSRALSHSTYKLESQTLVLLLNQFLVPRSS